MSQIHLIQSDLASVKLILVGGIEPATGKEVQGLAQSYREHVDNHKKTTKRYLAIVTIIATLIASLGHEIVSLFHK